MKELCEIFSSAKIAEPSNVNSELIKRTPGADKKLIELDKHPRKGDFKRRTGQDRGN